MIDWCVRFIIGVGKLLVVWMDLVVCYIDVVKYVDGFEELDKEVVVEFEFFILLYWGIVEEYVLVK